MNDARPAHWLLRGCLSLGLLGCALAAQAETTRVTCPEGLKWVFEGYCKKDFNVTKDNACPQRSKKAEPHIPGPIICYAKGICPEDTQPNAKGLCVKPGEK